MVSALAFIPSVYLLRILWLLSSNLQLLLRLSAWERNKQSRLRTGINHDTTYCYNRDNTRTIENGAIVKRTRLLGLATKQREDRLYVGRILLDEII